jgi:prophage regulatory protein
LNYLFAPTPHESRQQMKLLGFSDLKDKKGINWSRVHVSRLEKAAKFPKHVNLAPQSIGWIEEEIDAWIEARAAERSEKPAQIAGNVVDRPQGSLGSEPPSEAIEAPLHPITEEREPAR